MNKYQMKNLGLDERQLVELALGSVRQRLIAIAHHGYYVRNSGTEHGVQQHTDEALREADAIGKRIARFLLDAGVK